MCCGVWDNQQNTRNTHIVALSFLYMCICMLYTWTKICGANWVDTAVGNLCICVCTIASWRELRTPSAPHLRKIHPCCSLFYHRCSGFWKSAVQKEIKKKKQPKPTQNKGESFETDNTYILQGVNGWHAFLGMERKKKAHQKLVCYTADVLDVRASQWELCFVCAYVCACVCVMAETKKIVSLSIYIYIWWKKRICSSFFCVSNSLSFRVCHELLFTSTLIKWFRFVDNKNWLLSSDDRVTCDSLCIPFFFCHLFLRTLNWTQASACKCLIFCTFNE